MIKRHNSLKNASQIIGKLLKIKQKIELELDLVIFQVRTHENSPKSNINRTHNIPSSKYSKNHEKLLKIWENRVQITSSLKPPTLENSPKYAIKRENKQTWHYLAGKCPSMIDLFKNRWTRGKKWRVDWSRLLVQRGEGLRVEWWTSRVKERRAS